MDPAPSRHLTFMADRECVGACRRAMAAFALESGAGDETAAGVAVSVSEAVTNAVRHAYDDGRRPGQVRADAWLERANGDRTLNVRVSDDGPGMRPRTDSPGLGLGLPLIAHLAQAVDLAGDGAGATVLMKFALP
jgi:anti-sigma regulatory factor (Ser/Thr protein kinase)